MATTTLTVSQAIERGHQIIANHPTYSMTARGNAIDSPCHDCSSFVGTCWSVPTIPTAGMPNEYPKYGFQLIRGSFTSWKDLKKGDILVMHRGANEPGHTCMYIGDGKIMQMCLVGALIRGFYLTDGVPWTEILRGRGGIFIASWVPTDGIDDGF